MKVGDRVAAEPRRPQSAAGGYRPHLAGTVIRMELVPMTGNNSPEQVFVRWDVPGCPDFWEAEDRARDNLSR